MLRFGFVTCVQLGLECMQEIHDVGGRLDLVLTLPDDRAARKSGRVYVDGFCREHAVPLVKVPNVNDPEAVEAIRARGIDWLFIIGWSQIARAEVLGAPTRGALGMHPTLLPVGRGRAAIPWAILKGLPETGVTLFQLDDGVDTGPILAQERLPVSPEETATRLYERVARAHRSLIRRTWPDLAGDRIRPRPQDDARASYWPGRKPEDGRITAEMGPAEVDRLVRAVTRPYPGAFMERPDGTVLRVWAGRVARDGDPAPGAVRLALAGGAYDAVEFEVEQAPAAT